MDCVHQRCILLLRYKFIRNLRCKSHFTKLHRFPSSKKGCAGADFKVRVHVSILSILAILPPNQRRCHLSNKHRRGSGNKPQPSQVHVYNSLPQLHNSINPPRAHPFHPPPKDSTSLSHSTDSTSPSPINSSCASCPKGFQSPQVSNPDPHHQHW